MSVNAGSTMAESQGGIHSAFRDPHTQIRLLHLDLSSSEECISASLATWDVQSAPPYNAISYAWGDFTENHIIVVNSVALPVRKNCFYALQQTRLHYPGCYVWIDAICINQSDLKEKSAQVAMMGDIYKGASLVLACIGPTDAFIRTSREMYGKAVFQKTVLEETIEESFAKDEGSKAVMDVERSTMTHRWYPEGPANPGVFFPANDEDEALIVRLHHQWNALSERPYFERAWIVQELVGGTDIISGRTIVMSGQDSIGWTRLVHLGLRLNELLTNPITNLTTPYCDIRITNLNGLIYRTGRHFTKYLDNMVSMQCQDPRDRIFGIVSIVDWQSYGQTKLCPDYNMTRWQLASELFSRLVDMDVDHVRLIITALDLEEDAPQVLQDLRTKEQPHYLEGCQPDDDQRRACAVKGAFLIDRDASGRFQIIPQIPLRHKVETPFESWPPVYNDDLLARWREDKVIPIFLRDLLVAFAHGDIRKGDILLHSDSADFVLRACSDSTKFRIIGGAYVPLEFVAWIHHVRKANVCECWQGSPRRYVSRNVMVGFKITPREALANAVAREVASWNDRNLVVYIKSYAIGTLLRGSIVWDITNVNWHQHSIFGPPLPRCPAHRSSEMHRILRNAVWYTILSGGGPFIKVDVASMSDEWSTGVES